MVGVGCVGAGCGGCGAYWVRNDGVRGGAGAKWQEYRVAVVAQGSRARRWPLGLYVVVHIRMAVRRCAGSSVCPTSCALARCQDRHGSAAVSRAAPPCRPRSDLCRARRASSDRSPLCPAHPSAEHLLAIPRRALHFLSGCAHPDSSCPTVSHPTPPTPATALSLGALEIDAQHTCSFCYEAPPSPTRLLCYYPGSHCLRTGARPPDQRIGGPHRIDGRLDVVHTDHIDAPRRDRRRGHESGAPRVRRHRGDRRGAACGAAERAALCVREANPVTLGGACMFIAFGISSTYQAWHDKTS